MAFLWDFNDVTHFPCSSHHSSPMNDIFRQRRTDSYIRSALFSVTTVRMEQGHCGACRRKWRLSDTDLCPCGETQTMSHIVESCPLTGLNGGLSQLHSADEDAVSWLTNYGK